MRHPRVALRRTNPWRREFRPLRGRCRPEAGAPRTSQPHPPERLRTENRLQRHVPHSTHGRERRSPDRHSGAPRRARRNPTAGTATNTESAPATCTCRRTSYCDMYPPSRLPLSDMYLPRDPLLRRVTRQPKPLQRHVSPAEPATATCDPSADAAPATCAPAGRATATCARPTDPASATCAPRRTRYCDM